MKNVIANPSISITSSVKLLFDIVEVGTCRRASIYFTDNKFDSCKFTTTSGSYNYEDWIFLGIVAGFIKQKQQELN